MSDDLKTLKDLDIQEATSTSCGCTMESVKDFERRLEYKYWVNYKDLRNEAIKCYNSEEILEKYSERMGLYGFIKWFFNISEEDLK